VLFLALVIPASAYAHAGKENVVNLWIISDSGGGACKVLDLSPNPPGR